MAYRCGIVYRAFESFRGGRIVNSRSIDYCDCLGGFTMRDRLCELLRALVVGDWFDHDRSVDGYCCGEIDGS